MINLETALLRSFQMLIDSLTDGTAVLLSSLVDTIIINSLPT